jgi:uncharacterized protein (DUF58 family)
MTATVARSEASLRQLELLVLRKLDGLLQGQHQGLVPGGGTEPGDGRLYEPGDDVRRMDWNLTARSNAPHIRQTIADRELEPWLVVDGSASLDFGTADCEKRDLALAAAGAFGFLASRDGNRVGGVLFGSSDAGASTVVPPRSGRASLLALLHRIERRERHAEPVGPGLWHHGAREAPATSASRAARSAATQSEATLPRQSLAGALRQVRLTARRRGLVVVITDLLDDTDWPRELRALALRHDVVVAEVRDPREHALPDVGLLMLVDPETGRRVEVQTANRKVRERFEAAARERLRERARAVRTAGASHLVLSTDRDWLLDVVRFVGARRRRR